MISLIIAINYYIAYDYEASRAEQNDYEEQLATGDTFSLHVDASFIFQDQNTLEVSTETIETAWESQGNDSASS